jgi:hypothetical protein
VSPIAFNTKKVITNPVGSVAGSRERRGSSNASTTSSAKNATNHTTERRSPRRASAASGVKIAHKIIALDATKPPREACRRAGSTRNARSCVVRNTPNRRVRANTTSPTTVISW